jgi:hypothetical protein
MEPAMKTLMVLLLAIGLSGCGDFVDEDGNTSIRQIAEGLQSLGGRLAEMGEAIERDAGVHAVPWEDLMETIPDEIDGTRRLDTDGDETTDRNGAGLSMAHGQYVLHGDSTFVGVADLGALRGGVGLALRWVAPLFNRGEIDGDIEEIEVEGYPGIRIRDEEDGDLLVALIVEGRFAVIAGAEGRGNDDFVWDALESIDYDRLEDWVDYGKN